MESKTILVTGGCGFVGRHLIAQLAREAAHVIWIVDDLSTGKAPAKWEMPNTSFHKTWPNGLSEFRIAGTKALIRLIQKDFLAVALAELERIPNLGIERLPKFDEVYHLASVVGGRNIIENDPLAVGIDLAIDSVFFLWAAKVSRPNRILYASSSAAYPIHHQTVAGAIALKEEMIDFGDILGKPDYTYGWSKLTGEYLARIAVEKYNLSVAVVRPFSGYGEDQEPAYPFPSIALRVAARKNPVVVWGDGHQSRDFIHIDDATTACVLACRTISDAQAINIGWGKPISFRELASRMIEIEDYKATVQGLGGRPTGVNTRYSDPTKMAAVLNWTPIIPIDEGIRRALVFAHKRLASGVKAED